MQQRDSLNRVLQPVLVKVALPGALSDQYRRLAALGGGKAR